MIINASPLILFGKINRLDILKDIYKTIEITGSVYDEVVVKGIEKNYVDAYIIKDSVEDNSIKILTLNDKSIEIAKKLQVIYSIDIGESDTIALAFQLGRKEIIIDEISARESAKSLGIKPIGSLRVLLIAYKNDLISRKEVDELLTQMINSKYRLSPNVLNEFWNLFEKMKR